MATNIQHQIYQYSSKDIGKQKRNLEMSFFTPSLQEKQRNTEHQPLETQLQKVLMKALLDTST